MGGLEAYQRMSTIGQGSDRGGGSEKIFIGWMNELSVRKEALDEKHKLKLLEVGALRPDNYASCSSWIDVSPIDLHSTHPDIQEQDFLLLDDAQNRSKWDAISLSLVLNFVPEPRDRGQMLRLAHSFLRPGGLLFVALPLPCITNSRFCTPEHFDALMQSLSFEQLRVRWKPGGKMAYWLYKKLELPSQTNPDVSQFQKKISLRQGNRNNFVILL